MKNFTYKLQFIIITFFYKLILLFPEDSRFKFGEFLGEMGYKLVKKRRLTALANLHMAFPEKDKKEIEAIALKSFKIMAKAFLCTLWFDTYLNDSTKVINKNKEIFDNEYSKGKGLITALIHMGNMEAGVAIAKGYDIVTVSKKQRNPYLENFITENRKKTLNLELISKDKYTSRKLIERIHKKEIIALFSDHRDKGANVNFFGMEAKSPTGAISLAIKFDIPVVICYNCLNDDNSCTNNVEIFEIVKTGDFKVDVLTNTQRLINQMEDIIRRHPEQWMWFHDRWNLYRKIYKK